MNLLLHQLVVYGKQHHSTNNHSKPSQTVSASLALKTAQRTKHTGDHTLNLFWHKGKKRKENAVHYHCKNRSHKRSIRQHMYEHYPHPNHSLPSLLPLSPFPASWKGGRTISAASETCSHNCTLCVLCDGVGGLLTRPHHLFSRFGQRTMGARGEEE